MMETVLTIMVSVILAISIIAGLYVTVDIYRKNDHLTH